MRGLDYNFKRNVLTSKPFEVQKWGQFMLLKRILKKHILTIYIVCWRISVPYSVTHLLSVDTVHLLNLTTEKFVILNTEDFGDVKTYQLVKSPLSIYQWTRRNMPKRLEVPSTPQWKFDISNHIYSLIFRKSANVRVIIRLGLNLIPHKSNY